MLIAPSGITRLQDASDTPVLRGTLASRPAAGTTGRFYIATDRGELFFDTGSTWIYLGGQPQAYRNATAIASKSTATSFTADSWTTIILNSVSEDAGGNFNTSTGIYTCPLSGVYQLSFKVKLAESMAVNTNFGASINKGTDLAEANIAWANGVDNPNGNERQSLQFSRLARYVAGDQLRLQCFVNRASPSIERADAYFSFLQP